MAADGTIKINTEVDENGIAVGTVDIKKSMDKVCSTMKKTADKASAAYQEAFETAGEKIESILNDTEKSAKSKVASIAAIYRQEGESQQEAFKKAWEHIERDSASGSKKVRKHIKGISEESQKAAGRSQAYFRGSFSKIGSMIKKIGGMMAAAFAVRKIAEFGKECLELGSDLQEVQNVVDVTFPSMTGQVDEFAKAAAQSFGLSETMAKQFTGTFGAMAKSFGFSEKSAYDMSTALTGLAGDVASFYNLSQDEAYTKLKSVFTGETESLKDLGVVMTQTALDSYAIANGYGKTTSAMTEQEKVALRYRFVMDQLSAAQGDFARTSDSWANQTRILRLQLDSIKATIGQGLINVFTPVIKVINILLSKLATVAEAFKSFTELITGNKAQAGGGSGAVQEALPTGEEYNSAADGAESLAKSTDKAAKATKEAAKATNGYLSPLDEIERYQEEDRSSGSSPGTGAGGVGAAVESVNYGKLAEGETVIDKTSSALDTLIKKLNRLKKLIKKGFWDGLGDYKPILDQLQEDIASIGESMKDIFSSPEVTASASRLADTVAYSLGQTAGAAAGIGLSIASNLVGGIAEYLDGSREFIKARIVSMLDSTAEIYTIAGNLSAAVAEVFSVITGENGRSITASLIGIFSDGFLGIMDLALQFGADIINMIAAPFINNAEEIRTAIDTGILAPIATLLETLHTSLLETFQTIQGVYDEHIAPFFQSIRDGLDSIVGKVLEVWNTYIAPVLDSLAEKASQVWAEHVQPVIDKAIELLGKVADLLRVLWENVLQPLIEWIIENILPVVGPILESVGGFVLDLVATVSDSFGGILDILGGFIDYLTGVFSGDNELAWKGIEEIIGGFKTFVGNIFNFVQTRILEPFDKFLSGVFEKDWSESFGALGEVLNWFFDGVELVWNDIKDLLNGIISFIEDVFSGDWESAWNTIIGIFKGVFDGLIDLVKGPINAVIDIVNGAISKINGAIGGIENAVSFGPWEVPTPFGSKTIGFSADFPRVPHIPYLATGAVIPPNAPFAAVLGDQKNGTNLELPENLLRQIVREETAGQNGGSWQFTAQINRRTLFDEMITEAKLVRSQTGKNPFDMA